MCIWSNKFKPALTDQCVQFVVFAANALATSKCAFNEYTRTFYSAPVIYNTLKSYGALISAGFQVGLKIDHGS